MLKCWPAMKKSKEKPISKNDANFRRSFFFILIGLFVSLSALAQKITVTGQVKDPSNEGIIGASVVEKGTTNGTMTDMDGKFSLTVSPKATLTITYIGYKSQEIAVKGSIPLNIVLQENAELLEEVVVIGYGSVKRKDVTTSVASVSTKDLDERPIISAAAAIQGKAAGVNVIQPNGEPGAGMVVRIRGNSSINASNDPLYVVDGVPMTEINFLSPNDIESMKVDYRKKMLSVLTGLFITGFAFLGCGNGTVPSPEEPGETTTSDVDLYVTTANQSLLFKKIPLSFSTKDNMSPFTIQMNPSEVFQEMDGFGAAMTGSSCYNLLKMTAEDRAKLLKETFDPKYGMGYSYIRISIGASDFSLSEYTYCDNQGIENFALQSEDKNYVIPVLKEILAINPNVKILASPCFGWTKNCSGRYCFAAEQQERFAG